ncbi:MAG TPA: universal stress protein, partial [Spongiibacteraceae bacterium]|nr:universal stress protein [Spongiibacteraceae bacterium]
AYSDSLHHPDRSRLARESGVDRANIHTRVGDPEVVIADVAREIDADIVVLGTRSRASRWRGNTSERIITRVECDVLCIH